MRRAVRLTLLVLGAGLAVAALAALAQATPTPAAEPLGRRDLLVGLLALGVLALAAYGFDLREWF